MFGNNVFIMSFRHQGVLRIHVLEAKDLIKADIGLMKKGKSDPFAVVKGTFILKATCFDDNEILYITNYLANLFVFSKYLSFILTISETLTINYMLTSIKSTKKAK